MKRKSIFSVIAMVTLICALLCACGGKSAADTQTDGTPMTLTAWTLTPRTWSSPNGATIQLSADVNHRDDTVTAEFVVRQGDADVFTAPCTWDGDKLTAEAELNAADGYSYFVVLTAHDGTLTEIPMSTTENPVDISLVNLESALNSYCNVLVSASEYADGVLKLTAGSLEIQVPQITNDGVAITCSEAKLVLTHDGEKLNDVSVVPQDSEVPGGYEADLSGIAFPVPQLDDDGQLSLQLEVVLSNGQVLTAEGGSWTYIDGHVISTVG